MKHVLLILCAALCLEVQAGDYRRAPSMEKPSGVPGTILPEKQIEGHTCGLHSIRSIYKSYSLPVDEFALRARLGTDVATFPFFDSTQGTIHPDILRVLDQDGFKYVVIGRKDLDLSQSLTSHFASGHYALVLIQKKENEALHWVVFSGIENDRIQIVDSLKPEPYEEPLSFFKKHVLSVILIEPRINEDEKGRGESHSKGLWEGIKSLF